MKKILILESFEVLSEKDKVEDVLVVRLASNPRDGMSVVYPPSKAGNTSPNALAAQIHKMCVKNT